MAEYDQPHMELVKCVVIGDSGVGKTRLVCSRACHSRYSLEQLMQTHIPTVWAIDNYNMDREVLSLSFCDVDGVAVSLRLWDTFGYHDKDRRFACSRADVVLLCFSVVRPMSLRNVWNIWYCEIKRYCPGTPIVLCGCQNDLRHLYKDPKFKAMDKGLFFQEIKESEIITPEQGREVAKDIGAEYYETSVLTQHGVEHLFENITRAALIERRRMRFWNPQLKRINYPLCQPPYLPPPHVVPDIIVKESTYISDCEKLLLDENFADVVFISRGSRIYAHCVMLLAASSVFQQLFCSNQLVQLTRASISKMVSKPGSIYGANGDKEQKGNSDRQKLLEEEQTQSNKSDSIANFSHPAFECVYSFESLDAEGSDCSAKNSKTHKIAVVLNSDITPAVFRYILNYLYTGKAPYISELLLQVKQIAVWLELRDLVNMINDMLDGNAFLNQELEAKFFKERFKRMWNFAIQQGFLSDVVFQLDDGFVPAHKALLVTRCDWMLALFTDNFKESLAEVIPMPGLEQLPFSYLLEYLYLDDCCPDFSEVDPVELIELSNRLCLPRMHSLLESMLVKHLMKAHDDGENIMEDVLALIEPAQCFNAVQLASWCLSYLCNNYQTLHNKYFKFFKMLHTDNQTYLVKNRWPPLWYLKELDYYEKRGRDEERERISQQPISSLKRQRKNSGCLCIGRRQRVNHQTTTTSNSEVED
ncbi:rho-related BTB domain-containing protein 1-like [Tubulanus polymorphus]|uniref:rho-related BTB domain-containing protein 1-like n=1 Tax=Tubulanus polymorphus TaxID=672921 RepID=UPI003DA305AA